MAASKTISSKSRKAETALAAHASSFPEVTEHLPWGHRAFKVKGKTFLFLYTSEEGVSLSVKLPKSRNAALDNDFAQPTQYGLGRSGWITATFGPQQEPPLPLLIGWIDESYGAIAPKRLLAGLTGATANVAKPSKSAKARAPAPGRAKPMKKATIQRKAKTKPRAR